MIWARVAEILGFPMEDPYLSALAQLEGWADAMCLEAHDQFLTLRHDLSGEYFRGRADAFTEVLEYVAKVKARRTGAQVPD